MANSIADIEFIANGKREQGNEGCGTWCGTRCRTLLRVQIFSICNPLLLYYAARGLHFVTSSCFTNVASVERIIFATFICAIFSRFTGAGSTWSPRNK